MAFLRFNRDRRGYEHFYLVESTTNRRGKTRARVLYWFRSPPGVKVGREPFDPEVRRALELQNPGVVFDWRKIIDTPIPSADVERWRERRRAEKAARQPNAQKPAEESDADEVAQDDALSQDVSVDAAERQADALAPTEESLVAEAATIDPAVIAATAANVVAAGQPATTPGEGTRRRRRRRGRGGRSGGAPRETALVGDGGEVGPQESVDQPESAEPAEPEE